MYVKNNTCAVNTKHLQSSSTILTVALEVPPGITPRGKDISTILSSIVSVFSYIISLVILILNEAVVFPAGITTCM